MRRNLALLLLGMWIMGTISMAVVATQNFYEIDRLLESVPNESFRRIVEDVGPGLSRDFMRYLSSELNRLFFQVWGWAQLGLGAIVLAAVWDMEPHRIRYGAGAMFLLALLLAVVLTPPIVSVGRGLDFVPREPPPPELATFGLLHAAYTIIDFSKLALSSVVALWVARPPGPASVGATAAGR